MDVQQIAPHLWHWTAPHPEWNPEYEERGQGWGVVDPRRAVEMALSLSKQ